MEGSEYKKGTKEGFQGALDLSFLFDAFVKNISLFKNMLYNKSFFWLCQCSFSGNCEVSPDMILVSKKRVVAAWTRFHNVEKMHCRYPDALLPCIFTAGRRNTPLS